MRKVSRTLALAAAALLPATAGATSIIDLSESIQTTVYKPLAYAIIGFALLLFLWGVFRYIAQAGDEKKAAEGAKLMSYGVLVLFVLTCVWGLVHMGLAFFGFEDSTSTSSSGVFGLSTQGYDSGQTYTPTGVSSYSYDASGYNL